MINKPPLPPQGSSCCLSVSGGAPPPPAPNNNVVASAPRSGRGRVTQSQKRILRHPKCCFGFPQPFSKLPVTLLFWLSPLNPSGSLRTALQDTADFEASKMLFWLASALFQALGDPPSTRPRLHKSRSHRNNAEFKAQVACYTVSITR